MNKMPRLVGLTGSDGSATGTDFAAAALTKGKKYHGVEHIDLVRDVARSLDVVMRTEYDPVSQSELHLGVSELLDRHGNDWSALSREYREVDPFMESVHVAVVEVTSGQWLRRSLFSNDPHNQWPRVSPPWVNWEEIDKYIHFGYGLAIDVSTPKDADEIRNRGGVMICIKGTGVDAKDEQIADYVVSENGSVGVLYCQMIISLIRSRWRTWKQDYADSLARNSWSYRR